MPLPKTAPGMGDHCRETEGRWWPLSPLRGAGSSSIGKRSWQTLPAGTRLGCRTPGGPWRSCWQQTAVQLAGVPHTPPLRLSQPLLVGWGGCTERGCSAPLRLQPDVAELILKQFLIVKCGLLSRYCCKYRQEKATRQIKWPEGGKRETLPEYLGRYLKVLRQPQPQPCQPHDLIETAVIFGHREVWNTETFWVTQDRDIAATLLTTSVGL